MDPWTIFVPPKTYDPKSFVTGRDSPVSIDSSHEHLPNITVPSVGIPLPGYTNTQSLNWRSSTSISFEIEFNEILFWSFSKIKFALVTFNSASSYNLLIVFILENISINFPIVTIKIRILEVSKLWEWLWISIKYSSFIIAI